jgi:hypothetical protein
MLNFLLAKNPNPHAQAFAKLLHEEVLKRTPTNPAAKPNLGSKPKDKISAKTGQKRK